MRFLRSVCALGLLLLLPTDLHVADIAAAPASLPLKVLSGTIERNMTLAVALRDALQPQGVHNLVQAARPVYDLARLSVGRPFSLALGPEGTLAAFTYGIDELRTLCVRRSGNDLKAEVVTRDFDVETVAVSGVVRSSLFGAVADAGEEDQLAIDLADIFAWDVDFHTELQRGDGFRVVVEKVTVDGKFLRYGRIQAAEFVRGPRRLLAVRHEGERSRGFYAPDGTPLRKAFLRSPLRYTRISSGYTNARFHPILERFTAHLGIDYAAPTGTPVQAAADGVVTYAGWMDGFGNTVKLRHSNGYETLYGHLSAIAVRGGQRVEQGNLVGNVGMTGLATGPHLDYRMLVNGAYVNPLAMVSPPAEPIDPAERAAFEQGRDRLLAQLQRLPGGAPASAVLARRRGAPAPTA
jgi:murein DD-endopeptidase MepM/ murein hydrolase activator NlpD